MASYALGNVYTLRPDQSKALRRMGATTVSAYQKILASATDADKAAMKAVLSVKCLECLDRGYHYPNGSRKASTYCSHCATGESMRFNQSNRTRSPRKDAYYSVQVITSGYPEAPPDDRPFRTWQAAFGEAKRLLQTVPDGSVIDVVHRTWDAFMYRGVARWIVEGEHFERTI